MIYSVLQIRRDKKDNMDGKPYFSIKTYFVTHH